MPYIVYDYTTYRQITGGVITGILQRVAKNGQSASVLNFPSVRERKPPRIDNKHIAEALLGEYANRFLQRVIKETPTIDQPDIPAQRSISNNAKFAIRTRNGHSLQLLQCPFTAWQRVLRGLGISVQPIILTSLNPL
jgi:hypothetical protein